MTGLEPVSLTLAVEELTPFPPHTPVFYQLNYIGFPSTCNISTGWRFFLQIKKASTRGQQTNFF